MTVTSGPAGVMMLSAPPPPTTELPHAIPPPVRPAPSRGRRRPRRRGSGSGGHHHAGPPRAAAVGLAAVALAAAVTTTLGPGAAELPAHPARAHVTAVKVHRGGPDRTVVFHRAHPGEVFLHATVSAPGVSWAQRGNES